MVFDPVNMPHIIAHVENMDVPQTFKDWPCNLLTVTVNARRIGN